MKVTKEIVQVHYNFYSGSGLSFRENGFDLNAFRGVEFRRIQRPRILQNRRMLQNHQRILQCPHRQEGAFLVESSDLRKRLIQRESSLRESPHRRRESPRRQSPHRQEILQRLETLHLSETSQRLESPRRNWNPFVRNSASPFQRYRTPPRHSRSPFQRDSISRDRSLTPNKRQSPQRDGDTRNGSLSHRQCTPPRPHRRQKNFRTPLRRNRNPFLRDSVSRDRSLTPLIRRSPERSANERDETLVRRQCTPPRPYRRQENFRTPLRRNRNPFLRDSVSRDRSLTPLIRQSPERRVNEREGSISRRQCNQPHWYRRQNNFSRNARLHIRRPYKSQLLAYSRKISKLRILRRNASKALFQSLNGEIRALTKLSRAVRGLPLNCNKNKKKMAGRYREKVHYTQESEDEACLNEPDAFEFLD